MNFASDEFLLLLPLVFCVYWTLGRSARRQNVILLLASYLFYGWWDGRFLLLLVLSSVCDFFIAGKVESSEGSRRRNWLWLSVLINLGILGAFKYFGFFVDSFVELSAKLGVSLHPYTLNLVLPIGISFYTFQTLGYTIDVYKRRTPPCQNAIEFLTFVAFFPQLVAGPIERAGDMLVQFRRRRHFVYEEAASGFRVLLWGFFKKLVVADNCALIVDFVWSNSEARGGLQFSDLRRFLRVFRYRSWDSPILRNPPVLELPLPLFFEWLTRFLAAMAYHIISLVPGLCVYTAWR